MPLLILVSEACYHRFVYTHKGKVFAVSIKKLAIAFCFYMELLLLQMYLLYALFRMKHFSAVVLEMVLKLFV